MSGYPQQNDFIVVRQTIPASNAFENQFSKKYQLISNWMSDFKKNWALIGLSEFYKTYGQSLLDLLSQFTYEKLYVLKSVLYWN